jgi:hypothetical protein
MGAERVQDEENRFSMGLVRQSWKVLQHHIPVRPATFGMPDKHIIRLLEFRVRGISFPPGEDPERLLLSCCRDAAIASVSFLLAFGGLEFHWPASLLGEHLVWTEISLRASLIEVRNAIGWMLPFRLI